MFGGRNAGLFRSGGLRLLCIALCLLLVLPAFAAGPRSRVARRIAWFSLRTDHFIIHYPMSRGDPQDAHALSGARTARRASVFAEQLYAQYAKLLKLQLPGPVHVVIDAQLEDSPGRTDPEWLRIELASQAGPTWHLRSQGEDWLRGSLAHEIAHLFLVYGGSPVAPGMSAQIEAGIADRGWLARATGATPAGNPAIDAGLRVPLTDPAPFFWAEGGAEFLAELGGSNRWDPSRDMVLRMSTLENLVLSQSAWTSSVGKTGLDGERAYNQGYSFLLFLRERYGEESFGRIVAAARKKLHTRWTDVFEEGQGLSFDALYGFWRSWLEERYQPLADLKNREVGGEELRLSVPAWRSPDLEVRRRWMALPVATRRAEREGEGTMALFPTWSRDGKYVAWWDDGLRVWAIPEDQWPAYGGHALEAFRDRLELSRRNRRQAQLPDVRQYPVSWSPDGKRLVVVADEGWRPRGGRSRGGYGWNALWLVDVNDARKDAALQLSVPVPGIPIPNTLRAQDPAWSPDGRWIAFVRYYDGTANLWIIKPDGSEARALTKFTDGTDLGHPSWSPDAQHIVFHMYRRNQRDLWTIDVATQALQPIMLDPAVDLDPVWSSDGRIYYASDATGIFNLFAYDPSTLEVRRVTDVLGGVFSPELTPKGNLVFSYFDGYGMKVHGLPAAKVLDLPVDNASFFIDPSLTQGYLLGAQEAPLAEGQPYRILRGGPRLHFTPTLRITERDVAAGMQLRWQDPLELRSLNLRALAGMGSLIEVEVTDRRLLPELTVGAVRRSLKETVALREEEDGVTRVFERKHETLLQAAYGGATLYARGKIRLGLTANARYLSFREREDGSSWKPLHGGVGGGPEGIFSSFGRSQEHGARGIDPRGGFRVAARYALRQARVWDPVTGGLVVEEGDVLGTYNFQRIDLELQHALALPWLEHTFEWRFNAGTINRNVAWWDELKAGGRLSGLEPQLEPVVPFPGYDVFSLSGETLGVLSVAYRAPLSTSVAKRLGPIYLDRLYGQVGGTVGNVWGYQASAGGEPAVREGFDAASQRNTPAGGEARLLAEAGLELRLQASLFNRYRWGSFLRLGYAFAPVSGLGDVDRDGVYPGAYGDLLPEAGGEVFPAGVRVSLGLGTGFW